MYRIGLIGFALALLASPAFAASSDNVQIVVSCPGSTSISLTANSPWVVSGSYPTHTLSYPNTSPVPVPAGSLVATIVPTPSGACVLNPLSGPGMASFALSGFNLNVGATALPAGNYSITVSGP